MKKATSFQSRFVCCPTSPDLEPHAYRVNEKIKDVKIRGLNIMCAI